jgi:hypothetical protein
LIFFGTGKTESSTVIIESEQIDEELLGQLNFGRREQIQGLKCLMLDGKEKHRK